jgi:hypothetical protein
MYYTKVLSLFCIQYLIRYAQWEGVGREEGGGRREEEGGSREEGGQMEGAGTSSGDKREMMNYLKASKLFFLLANHHIKSPETRGLTDEVTTLLPLLYPSLSCSILLILFHPFPSSLYLYKTSHTDPK